MNFAHEYRGDLGLSLTIVTKLGSQEELINAEVCPPCTKAEAAELGILREDYDALAVGGSGVPAFNRSGSC